jgi:DNA-binding transcriptional ArsR family regulator
MSNGFPYWQFHCDRWLSGKISAFSLAEQGLFLHFCMAAWIGKGRFEINPALLQRKFNMSSTDVEQALSGLLECGIVYRDEEGYGIKFMDQQLEALNEKREKLSKAGQESAKARADIKKRRVKLTREEKNVEHPFNNCSTDVEHSKEKKRNLIMDALALCECENLKEINRAGWKRIASSLKEIKEVCPDVTPEEIAKRAKHYRTHFDGAALTSNALAKHWARCATAAEPKAPNAQTLINTWHDPNPDQAMHNAF